MLEGKIKLLLEMAGDLSLQEIDEALEHHQRQVDMLRLLRQITVIREESQFVGASPEAPTVKNEQTFTRLANTLELPENPPEQPVRQLPNKRDSSLTEPIPTTVAYRIRQLLKDGKPRTADQITNELKTSCYSAVCSALREWSRKGLFQKDKNRCWSLCQPNSNGAAPILPAKPPATSPYNGSYRAIAA